MFKGLRTRQTNDLSLFMGKKDEMPVCVSKAATKQNKTKKKKKERKKEKDEFLFLPSLLFNQWIG